MLTRLTMQMNILIDAFEEIETVNSKKKKKKK